jgi:hypothetical protein
VGVYLSVKIIYSPKVARFSSQTGVCMYLYFLRWLTGRIKPSRSPLSEIWYDQQHPAMSG